MKLSLYQMREQNVGRRFLLCGIMLNKEQDREAVLQEHHFVAIFSMNSPARNRKQTEKTLNNGFKFSDTVQFRIYFIPWCLQDVSHHLGTEPQGSGRARVEFCKWTLCSSSTGLWFVCFLNISHLFAFTRHRSTSFCHLEWLYLISTCKNLIPSLRQS